MNVKKVKHYLIFLKYLANGMQLGNGLYVVGNSANNNNNNNEKTFPVPRKNSSKDKNNIRELLKNFNGNNNNNNRNNNNNNDMNINKDNNVVDINNLRSSLGLKSSHNYRKQPTISYSIEKKVTPLIKTSNSNLIKTPLTGGNMKNAYNTNVNNTNTVFRGKSNAINSLLNKLPSGNDILRKSVNNRTFTNKVNNSSD